MRANGDTYCMQNLHQHQHNEELVQYPQSLGCNRPMTETDPQDLARGCDGHKGRDNQQQCENGVEDYLGLARKVAKEAGETVLDHVRLKFKTKYEMVSQWKGGAPTLRVRPPNPFFSLLCRLGSL